MIGADDACRDISLTWRSPICPDERCLLSSRARSMMRLNSSRRRPFFARVRFLMWSRARTAAARRLQLTPNSALLPVTASARPECLAMTICLRRPRSWIDALVGSSVLEQRRDMESRIMGRKSPPTSAVARPTSRRAASDDLRHVSQFPGVDVGPTARDMTKRDDDFLKRGVAGAFAQTKHRHRSVQGPARIAAERAVASPMSSCPWNSIGKSVSSRTRLLTYRRPNGSRRPKVSAKRKRVAPSCAAARESFPCRGIGAKESSPPRATERPRETHSRRRVAPVPPRHRRRRRASRQSASRDMGEDILTLATHPREGSRPHRHRLPGTTR